LSRIRYGNVTLPADLRAGDTRELDPPAIAELMQIAAVSDPPAPMS
jgi:16S rRNA U516 pseudouridylate synthase RsuA-like enzyme